MTATRCTTQQQQQEGWDRAARISSRRGRNTLHVAQHWISICDYNLKHFIHPILLLFVLLYDEGIAKTPLGAADIPLCVQPDDPDVQGTSGAPPAHTSRSVQLASLSVRHSITGHLKPRSGGYMTLNWEEEQAADGLFTHPSHTVIRW